MHGLHVPWIDRADLMGIEQHPDRNNFGKVAHGLGDLAEADR